MVFFFLGSRDSQNCLQPQVWNWTRAAEFQWDSRAREPSSATEESDGKRPVYTQKERLRMSQQPATSMQQKHLRTSQQPATSTQQKRLRTSQQPATSTQQKRLRTSQQPATSTQQKRLRMSQQPATSTQQERLSRSGHKRGERAVRAEECGGIRGRPSAAGRTDAEVAIYGVKGGGAFWILQSKAL